MGEDESSAASQQCIGCHISLGDRSNELLEIPLEEGKLGNSDRRVLVTFSFPFPHMFHYKSLMRTVACKFHPKLLDMDCADDILATVPQWQCP